MGLPILLDEGVDKRDEPSFDIEEAFAAIGAANPLLALEPVFPDTVPDRPTLRIAFVFDHATVKFSERRSRCIAHAPRFGQDLGGLYGAHQWTGVDMPDIHVSKGMRQGRGLLPT